MSEIAKREVRSVAYQMKIARFPAYRDLAGFDFSQSVANEATVRELHRCEFMAQAPARHTWPRHSGYRRLSIIGGACASSPPSSL